MKLVSRILLSLTIILLYSCSSDSEDDLTPPPGGKITYNQHIKPAVDANCTGCHGNPLTNNAPFPLTNYNEVRNRASSILAAISKQTGETGAMPPTGRLSQATIDAVDQWIKDGLLEN